MKLDPKLRDWLLRDEPQRDFGPEKKMLVDLVKELEAAKKIEPGKLELKK